MKREFTTQSEAETRRLASAIGRRLDSGMVVLLHGQLGAGKTTFVQGVAAGMGIATPVTSPTFTLVHEYPGNPLTLFHLDCYRLDGPDEVEGLGWDEILCNRAVVVVEWPERLGYLTPAHRLEVRITPTDDTERSIELSPFGANYAHLLEQLC